MKSMVRRFGAALPRAIRRVIRVVEGMLSIVISVGMALAPAAGAIAVGWVFTRGSIPLPLVATAAVGATILGVLGFFFRSHRNNRSKRQRLSQGSSQDSETVSPSPIKPLPNTMVTFHDFNPQRRRFEHW